MSNANDPMVLIEELRREVIRLSERVAQLEASANVEPISEEVLAVIAAAVAAFLGERARVRQVRLVRSTAWTQQGRVSIQASHRLSR